METNSYTVYTVALALCKQNSFDEIAQKKKTLLSSCGIEFVLGDSLGLSKCLGKPEAIPVGSAPPHTCVCSRMLLSLSLFFHFQEKVVTIGACCRFRTSMGPNVDKVISA